MLWPRRLQKRDRLGDRAPLPDTPAGNRAVPQVGPRVSPRFGPRVGPRISTLDNRIAKRGNVKRFTHAAQNRQRTSGNRNSSLWTSGQCATNLLKDIFGASWDWGAGAVDAFDAAIVQKGVILLRDDTTHKDDDAVPALLFELGDDRRY